MGGQGAGGLRGTPPEGGQLGSGLHEAAGAVQLLRHPRGGMAAVQCDLGKGQGGRVGAPVPPASDPWTSRRHLHSASQSELSMRALTFAAAASFTGLNVAGYCSGLTCERP